MLVPVGRIIQHWATSRIHPTAFSAIISFRPSLVLVPVGHISSNIGPPAGSIPQLLVPSPAPPTLLRLLSSCPPSRYCWSDGCPAAYVAGSHSVHCTLYTVLVLCMGTVQPSSSSPGTVRPGRGRPTARGVIHRYTPGLG